MKNTAEAIDRHARGRWPGTKRHVKRAAAKARRRAWKLLGEDAPTRCLKGWVS